MAVYYTKCCNFEYIGKNHSPEYQGLCRKCYKQWIGSTTSRSKSPRQREGLMEKIKNHWYGYRCGGIGAEYPIKEDWHVEYLIGRIEKLEKEATRLWNERNMVDEQAIIDSNVMGALNDVIDKQNKIIDVAREVAKFQFGMKWDCGMASDFSKKTWTRCATLFEPLERLRNLLRFFDKKGE